MSAGLPTGEKASAFWDGIPLKKNPGRDCAGCKNERVRIRRGIRMWGQRAK